jgi:hypothetical protein
VHHHGSDTPTSPRAILHHTDAILCTILHTTVTKVLLKYKVEKKELSVHSCKALLLLYQKQVPEQKLVSAQRYSLSIW